MSAKTSAFQPIPAYESQRIAITVPEAAAAVGLSRDTIDRAIRGGKLPVHYVGRKPLIRPGDLTAWITGAPGYREPRPAPATPGPLSANGMQKALTRQRNATARAFRAAEREKGFTLIELLVVVIIIGILAAIAVPVFLNQKAKAYDASVKSDLKSLATTAETYFSDNSNYGASPSAVGAVFSAPLSSGNAFWIDVLSQPAGSYVIYGKNAKSSIVWVMSSATGSVPTRSVATTVPVSATIPADPAGTVVPSGSPAPVVAWGAPLGSAGGTGFDASLPAPTGVWGAYVSWRTAGWGATCSAGTPVFTWSLVADWGSASGTNDPATSYAHTADLWGSRTPSQALTVSAACSSGGAVGPSTAGVATP